MDLVLPAPQPSVCSSPPLWRAARARSCGALSGRAGRSASPTSRLGMSSASRPRRWCTPPPRRSRFRPSWRRRRWPSSSSSGGRGSSDLAWAAEADRPPRGCVSWRHVARHARHARLMRDDFLVDLLTRRPPIFFLALLPQFVDVTRGHVATGYRGARRAARHARPDDQQCLRAGSRVGRELLKHSRVYASVDATSVDCC